MCKLPPAGDENHESQAPWTHCRPLHPGHRWFYMHRDSRTATMGRRSSWSSTSRLGPPTRTTTLGARPAQALGMVVSRATTAPSTAYCVLCAPASRICAAATASSSSSAAGGICATTCILRAAFTILWCNLPSPLGKYGHGQDQNIKRTKELPLKFQDR